MQGRGAQPEEVGRKILPSPGWKKGGMAFMHGIERKRLQRAWLIKRKGSLNSNIGERKKKGKKGACTFLGPKKK